jgi:hypothetical protein
LVPTTDLDDVEGREIASLPRFKMRSLGRPFGSQSLCRLFVVQALDSTGSGETGYLFRGNAV